MAASLLLRQGEPERGAERGQADRPHCPLSVQPPMTATRYSSSVLTFPFLIIYDCAEGRRSRKARVPPGVSFSIDLAHDARRVPGDAIKGGQAMGERYPTGGSFLNATRPTALGRRRPVTDRDLMIRRSAAARGVLRRCPGDASATHKVGSSMGRTRRPPTE
jgi:hypothetical protein